MKKRAPHRLRAAAALTLLALATSSCGLPAGGSATRVADDSVPYRLLETTSGAPGATDESEVPEHLPVVFWVDDHDRLVPEASEQLCAEDATPSIRRLLEDLAAGPSYGARSDGRSTTLPPESTLALIAVSGGTAEVEFDPETSISPDRLPIAVGQIVLTVASAPGIDAVTLVSDGAPVQMPLPGGALADGPVTAESYAGLVPDRYQRVAGCSTP